MKNYEVSLLDYDELSEEEQDELYCGEDDSYLRVDGRLYSDGYEPEDVKFYRSLSWVPTEIEKAYEAGYTKGYGDGYSDGYTECYDKGYSLGWDRVDEE